MEAISDRRSRARGGLKHAALIDDWLPPPRILHPWPELRFRR